MWRKIRNRLRAAWWRLVIAASEVVEAVLA